MDKLREHEPDSQQGTMEDASHSVCPLDTTNCQWNRNQMGFKTQARFSE